MATAKIIRLEHVNATKYYLNAWRLGKVCCSYVKCEGKLFEASGLCQHYRIVHDTCENIDQNIMHALIA